MNLPIRFTFPVKSREFGLSETSAGCPVKRNAYMAEMLESQEVDLMVPPIVLLPLRH